MEGLIRQLLTLPQLQELTAGMAGREKHSMVTGLSPVQRAAVAAAAAEQTGRPLLMLCADEQECARQTADLRALTGEEPVVLPAKLPNLLVNGSAGIAVGMATNIPPHNLNEVIDACRYLLHNPEATIDELIARMPAPDFPTGAIIYGLKDVHQGYRTGRGRVVMRSHTHFEELKNGRQALVVDDIPYQVNKKVLVESIARLIHEKKIEGISELRDESSQTVRIVMELKQGAFCEVILNNLY